MKFNCKDELVNLLKKYGYNLVLLPRENISPLQIFARKKSGIMARLSDIFTTPVLDDKNARIDEIFITDSQPLPVPQSGDVVNDVKGKRSSDVNIEAGVELMLNFMNLPDKEKTEAQKLKLKATFQSVEKISFSFGDEASDESVSEVALDSYLKDAEIRDVVGHSFREMVDGNQLYIVTSVLKSNAFTMKGISKDKASAALSLPKIKEVLEGSIEGNLDLFEQSGIKYKGQKQLVFGFKAVRLIAKKEDKKYLFKIETRVGMAVKGDEDFPFEALKDENNFVELD